MTRCSKAVLAVLALCVLALPVKAEEKVWYCEMTGVAETTIEGVERYKTEKFKLKVSPTEVVFGSGGYFADMKLKIVTWGDVNVWKAMDDLTVLTFNYGELHYARGFLSYAIAISALCDDF